MNTLRTQAQELLNELNEVIIQAVDFESQNMKEKVEQFNAIQQSITVLEKNKTPVPEELRTLKIKLLDELSHKEENEKFIDYLTSTLKEFLQKIDPSFEIMKRHVRESSNKHEKRIRLLDLINSGIIQPPSEIFLENGGDRFTGVINQRGQIELEISGKMRSFNNPTAASYALGRKRNGWYAWFIEYNGVLHRLMYLKNLLDDRL